MSKKIVLLTVIILIIISGVSMAQMWGPIYNPTPVSNETSSVGGVYQSGGKGNTCYIKKQSWVSSNSTGTVALQTLLTNTISASEIGANGHVEYELDLTMTNNANEKLLLNSFGTGSVNEFSIKSLPSTHVSTKIMNRGIVTSQFAETHLFSNASTLSNLTSTMAVTTTSAVALVTKLTLSNASDVVTINGYRMAICHGD